jgi:hypothetical protein
VIVLLGGSLLVMVVIVEAVVALTRRPLLPFPNPIATR